jgi:class 3 adenylate cyclase
VIDCWLGLELPPELEAAFRDEHARKSVGQVRTVALLVVLVYLSYVPITAYYPNERGEPFPHRELVIHLEIVGMTISVAFAALTFFRWFPKIAQPATAAAMFAIGAQTSAVTLLLPHPFDAMGLASIVIVLLATFTCMRLRFVWASAASLAVVAAFAFELVVLGSFQRPHILAASVYLATAIVLGMFVAWLLERLVRNEFVQARSLDEERQKSERLLLNVLPVPIAARLKAGESAIADSFGEATVLFADVVGFTPLAATMKPEALVALLNDMFVAFDGIAARHGLEKIKTIGDAYMAAAGLPEPRADHAALAVQAALEMLAAVKRLDEERGVKLDLRIGVHSGPVVAGVIGKSKFAYDLWGDTVNTASRMESHGVPGAVQVSAETRARLGDRFKVVERPGLNVKGKGVMSAFLVEAEST